MLWSLLETDIVTGNEVPIVSIGESFIYALVGFAVTFLGIAILILLVWLAGKIISAVTGRGKEKKSVQPAPAAAAASVADDGDGISEEVRVAIIAAISAYYMSEKSSCDFKVKRIKRL